jgi:hypothetical protein
MKFDLDELKERITVSKLTGIEDSYVNFYLTELENMIPDISEHVHFDGDYISHSIKDDTIFTHEYLFDIINEYYEVCFDVIIWFILYHYGENFKIKIDIY